MAGDASFASVSLLLHCDGSNGSTTFTDSGPGAKTVTATAAQISTAQSKFGGASALFNGSSARLSVPASADFDFGTGDFTIEIWARFASHTTVQTLFGNYQNSTNGWSLQRRSDTNTIRLGNGDTALIDVSWTPTDNTWYHLAVCRSGTSLRAFVDGSQVGSTATSSDNISGSTNELLVGALYFGSFVQHFNGYIDDLRITKGVARYTSNFTAPASAFLDYAGQVSGNVKDSAGSNAARTVRAYRRDTGALVGSTTSNGTTGNYTINCATLEEVTVIALDNATSGTYYNDQAARVIPA